MKQPNDSDWMLLEALWSYLLVESEMPDRADAIVIGGSGAMTDGAERAADLYHAGVSKQVVTSGFSNPYLTSLATPEAVILADRLVELGIPRESILVDELARNTGDNILNSAEALDATGTKPKDIVLVHKPYMTRRFLATAQAQWPIPQPNFFVTSKPITPRDYYALYESLDDENKMIQLMIGDYDRIKAYPAQGLSIEQPFSQEAEDAVRELKARGFASKEML